MTDNFHSFLVSIARILIQINLHEFKFPFLCTHENHCQLTSTNVSLRHLSKYVPEYLVGRHFADYIGEVEKAFAQVLRDEIARRRRHGQHPAAGRAAVATAS